MKKEEGWLTAATETGRFHLELLHLNRPQLRSHRQKRAFIGRLEQRLAANGEEGLRWDALTAEGRDELLEMLRLLYRLPDV